MRTCYCNRKHALTDNTQHLRPFKQLETLRFKKVQNNTVLGYSRRVNNQCTLVRIMETSRYPMRVIIENYRDAFLLQLAGKVG